ncbi:hypothetical protein [Staphylococcus phage PT94]
MHNHCSFFIFSFFIFLRFILIEIFNFVKT